MKTRHLLIHILTVLLAFPLTGTPARAATIEVLEIFDYPGTGNQTRPQKINDRGVIAGIYIDGASGASRGFYRRADGVFIAGAAPEAGFEWEAMLFFGTVLRNGRCVLG